MKWTLVAQAGTDKISLYSSLKALGAGPQFDRLDVAVAYATLQGAKALEMALGGIPARSRWVVGLDDAITQPEAIDHLLKVAGATVRLAKMAPAGRFHPKLYCLWSSLASDQCISALGSGNMTLSGLRSNGEIAAILSAESALEAAKLKAQWQVMWQLGNDATEEAIAEYRELYKKAKQYRKKIIDLGAAPPEIEPDFIDEEVSYDGAPSSAQIAWLEAGSPSAGGRDLEFPKPMMAFFGLKRGPATRLFRMPNGESFSLTFTERLDNQMWRLMFSTASIQAAIGRDTLRPVTGKNRSDLAVAFRRIPGANGFEVTMAIIGSKEYEQMRSISEKIGGIFSTSGPGGRYFGYI